MCEEVCGKVCVAEVLAVVWLQGSEDCQRELELWRLLDSSATGVMLSAGTCMHMIDARWCYTAHLVLMPYDQCGII
jgi:hypothetical protein